MRNRFAITATDLRGRENSRISSARCTIYKISGIRSLTIESRFSFVNSSLYDSELRLFMRSLGECGRDGISRRKADFLHCSFGNSLPVRVGRPVCPTRTANPIETKELHHVAVPEQIVRQHPVVLISDLKLHLAVLGFLSYFLGEGAFYNKLYIV